MDEQVINKAKRALNGTDWREFVHEHGESVSRDVTMKIAADKMRTKGLGGSLATVATDCLLSGLDPVDADVIFRLRSLRGSR